MDSTDAAGTDQQKRQGETWETWSFDSESFDSESFDSDRFRSVVQLATGRLLPFSQF